MKGLLHSRIFRRNLRKWLFMYVGAMGLLFTVVTYSKYISSMFSSDGARVTRFAVDIAYSDTNCTLNSNCNLGQFRPTTALDYEFDIKTEFEVKTAFVVNIYVNNLFNINSLMIGSEVIPIQYDGRTQIDMVSAGGVHYSISPLNNLNMITLTSSMPAGTISDKHYKLNIQANTNQDIAAQVNDIVTVGYSAKQVK